MTQEDKELLIKDLCSRIPYNVICQFNDSSRVIDNVPSPIHDGILTEHSLDLFRNHVGFDIKPYLRPMSSMTEKDKRYLMSLKYQPSALDWKNLIISSQEVIDWLNAHNFDYRGLIEKGLAIEATEDMYK